MTSHTEIKIQVYIRFYNLDKVSKSTTKLDVVVYICVKIEIHTKFLNLLSVYRADLVKIKTVFLVLVYFLH